MGRPFILYEEPDVTDLSLSTSTYHTYEQWCQAALKALDESRSSSNTDVFSLLEYLFSKRRVAFLPICEAASDRFLSLYESKIGGVPYLLPSESWPCNNGRSLTHLCQLRVRDLPAAVRQALGYNQGLLQGSGISSGCWTSSRLCTVRCLRSYFPLTSTCWSSNASRPLDANMIFRLPKMRSRPCRMEAGLYSTLPGDKLLGWPRWCGAPIWRMTDDGEAYVQLMQIEDSVAPFTVGTGTLLLQRHPTDRQQWDASWAC
ncbi:hypothetical protein VaNZ11_013737 [Volvox africanus]|uniref:Uncharacterized protein n=1 Tax=Volvox africanus TaxID=51714 RepID=A0ABQ5SGW2_9CHLO|nr:hypothetical protein VaNZ11_013737 [Volvox africanus]